MNGYLGIPTFHRPNRTGQYLFINRRPVTSSLISFAIRSGYGTALANNRYPVFVMHLKIPGELIDVNVHPQKKEVRLRNESALKEVLSSAVQQSLHNKNPHHFYPSTEELTFELAEVSSIPAWNVQPNSKENPDSIFEKYASSTQSPFEAMSHNWMRNNEVKPESTTVTFFKSEKRCPKILTTLQGYLLIDPNETDLEIFGIKQSGLCLINQRSAYARIYFERILKEETPSASIQTLLIPYTIELSRLESIQLKEFLPLIKKMGFGIEELGEQTFVIDAIPSLFKNEDLTHTLIAIIEDLKEFQDSRRIQRDKEQRVAWSACRSAATRRLSIEEGEALLNQLINCENAQFCPMGKPIGVCLTTQDLEQLFQSK